MLKFPPSAIPKTLAAINMTPPFLIVTIYRGNAIDILNGDYPLDQTTLYRYIKHNSDKSVDYDKDGVKWTSSNYSQKIQADTVNKLLT